MDDESEDEHRYYFLDKCKSNGYSSWFYYDGFDGCGSSYYGHEEEISTYDFYGRPIITEVQNRNSVAYYEYEKIRKWTDNRPWGSTATARDSNTGYIDTWRVVKKYDIYDSYGDTENSPCNIYQYNYSTGTFTDETGYNKKDYLEEGPGFLDPDVGKYKVVVTNPNGSKETYEYTSHLFDEGFRRKWEIDLPLLDKKTVSESSDSSGDTITEEYSYNDNYAIISPTQIKTTKQINGTSETYYEKIQYDSNSCLPVMQTLPLTQEEANASAVPESKKVLTQYNQVSSRFFVPETVTYYKEINGDALTEINNVDELGRTVTTEDAAGNVVNYEYSDEYPWLVTRIWFGDPENENNESRISSISYEYTDAYLLGPTKESVSTIGDEYAINTFEYEPCYGNVSKIIDADSNVTTYSYDEFGRPQYVHYPEYNPESGRSYLFDYYTYTDYSPFNDYYYMRVCKRTYRASSQSSTSGTLMTTEETYYDDYGNLHYNDNEYGTEAYFYDNSNRVASYRNPSDYLNGVSTLSYSYDGFDRPVSVADSMGNTQNVTYNSLSNEYSFTPADATVSENHYVENFDIYGNKISEKIYPDGISSGALTTSYEYDLAGNVIKTTDANGKITRTDYDLLNNPYKITRADGSVVDNEYTKWNTVKKTTRYVNNQPYTISQTYDNRGSAVSHRQIGLEINTKPWYYNYTPSGKLSEVVTPSGNKRTYDYDGMGNVAEFVSGNLTDTMKYNHFGQLDKITRTTNGDASSTDVVDYTYDSAKGFLLSKQTGGKTTSYTYNTIGSLVTETSPGGLVRTYTRDGLERITNVSADDKNFGYEYYADGLIKKITYPTAGITTSYTYDNANRLETLVTQKGSEILASYSYEYDNVGNIISISGTENVQYTYDNLYRLKTSTINGVTTTYAYDNRDNLISETTGNNVKRYEYSGDNRLAQVTENGVKTKYEYDLNGNMIKRGDDEFVYDANDKLVYANVDEVVTTYEIGLDGLRKSKTTNGVTTTYDVDESGNVITENDDEIIMGHKPLAKKIDGSYYYYIYNGHGDVVMLVDENGNVKNSYTYDPWGVISSESEEIENSHKYSGEYIDAETGLIYLRARYYDPEIRRFISEDPIRDDLNWYAYCGNNPVRFVDPYGLIPTTKEAAEMANHIYDYDEESSKDDRVVCGWRLIDVWYGNESVKMGIYIRDTDDWTNPSEYALVFRGSIIELSLECLDVWKNNVQQYVSSGSVDMWDALYLGSEFVKLKSQEITFIGHSKGGAEALAAAISTNKNAIVFNPAKLNTSAYNVSSRYYAKTATSHIIKGEFINEIFGSPGVGETKYYNSYYKTPEKYVEPLKSVADIVNQIRNHSIETFLLIL